MNGVHPSHDLLQRHHDGDLSGAENGTVELRQHLEACPKCQAELASLSRLRSMLRRSAETDLLGYGDAAHVEPDFTRMFAEIQKAVAQPQPASTAPAHAPNVVPLAPARQRGARWLYRGAPALGAVALAAAALLMVYRSEMVSPPSSGGVQNTEDAVAAVGRAEIVKVEFGAYAGQVFDIPLSDGSSVPVVWIDDDDDEEE